MNDQQIKEIDANDIALDQMSNIIGTGVLATVRITAARFGFSIKLDDLGLIPTRKNRANRTRFAITNMLGSSQRASLLPKHYLWINQEGSDRLVQLQTPETTERRIRALFPTKYAKNRTKNIDSSSTMLAIPVNGMTFIPLRSWEQWSKEYAQAKQDHLQSAKNLVNNYDRLKKESLRHYTLIAIDIYNRILTTSPDTLQRYDYRAREMVTITPLAWTRQWKSAVLRAWPTKQQILDAYTVEAKFFWAPVAQENIPQYIGENAQNYLAAAETEAISQVWDHQQATKRVFEEIKSHVSATQRSQSHELAVSYVQTILERTEKVFGGFLTFLETEKRSASTKQLNSVLKVAEMIQSLGSGVSGLSGIVQQAKQIEQFIEDAKNSTSQNEKSSLKKSKSDHVASELPEIITQALETIRQEAEAMIGNEARRSIISASDEFVTDFSETGIVGLSTANRSRLIIDEDSPEFHSEFLLDESSAILVENDDSEGDMTSSRRIG